MRVSGWYARTERVVEIVSGKAIWHPPGRRVPIRYVLVRDPTDELKPRAFLCTDLDADPLDILSWFVRRWSIEVTFAEARRHLGVETRRQWTDPERLPRRAQRDVRLQAEIRRIWEENFRVYGVRKVWRQLRREGIEIARCTTARLMKQMGLAGAIRGKTVKTVSSLAAPCPRDKVNRQFQAPRPNALWLSDFTYGAPRPGWPGVHMTGMQRRKEDLNECLALCCEGA